MAMSNDERCVFVASAPGKIIVSGEHAVVHGTHALATVVGKRTYAEFSPLAESCLRLKLCFYDLDGRLTKEESFEWRLEALVEICKLWPEETGMSQCVGDSGIPEPVMRAIHNLPNGEHIPCAVLLVLYTALFGESAHSGLRIIVRSRVPIGAGLGSSASFCSALVAGFYQCLRASVPEDGDESATHTAICPPHDDKECINRWAYQGESIIHGNPSGVDNTVSVFGGAIVYRKGHDIHFLERVPPLHLLITNTKVPGRSTKRLVAGVGRLKKLMPDVIDLVIEAIDKLCLRFVALVGAAQNVDAECGVHPKELVGESDHKYVDAGTAEFDMQCKALINANQQLLNAIGVGHGAIDSVVREGAKIGFASKLTGAGGGGCVISYVPSDGTPDQIAEYHRNVRALGFESFSTTIGQEGVLIYPHSTMEQIWSRSDDANSMLHGHT